MLRKIAAFAKTIIPLERSTPPTAAVQTPGSNGNSVNDCEYAMAFQLFPVIQYRRNSVKTQTNGASRNAQVPKRRRKIESTKPKIPGKSAATAVTQNSRKYANSTGKPA